MKNSTSATLGGSANPPATDSAWQSPAPSTRLADCFARAKEKKRAALVIYLTAQDPDDETSRRLVLAAAEAGADIIEIGIPWSDPSADGKAIQAATDRALASGGGMTKGLALARTLRQAHPDVGIVLFGYANPIIVMGAEAFAKAAREAGADGVLCVDYPADLGACDANDVQACQMKEPSDWVATVFAPARLAVRPNGHHAVGSPPVRIDRREEPVGGLGPAILERGGRHPHPHVVGHERDELVDVELGERRDKALEQLSLLSSTWCGRRGTGSPAVRHR